MSPLWLQPYTTACYKQVLPQDLHKLITLEMTMLDVLRIEEFRESRIEEEPILGRVLVMPGGRIQSLTFMEKVMLALRLTDAKRLEARYAAKG